MKNNTDTMMLINFAKALVFLYEEGGFNGIADEMTTWNTYISNTIWDTVEEANQFLTALSSTENKMTNNTKNTNSTNTTVAYEIHTDGIFYDICLTNRTPNNYDVYSTFPKARKALARIMRNRAAEYTQSARDIERMTPEWIQHR